MHAEIRGCILEEKAEERAKELGLQAIPSKVWVSRWRRRHNIGLLKICGDAAGVDREKVNDWLNNDLQELLKDCTPDQIFNADETGLFYKCRPDRTFAFKGDITNKIYILINKHCYFPDLGF